MTVRACETAVFFGGGNERGQKNDSAIFCGEQTYTSGRCLKPTPYNDELIEIVPFPLT